MGFCYLFLTCVRFAMKEFQLKIFICVFTIFLGQSLAQFNYNLVINVVNEFLLNSVDVNFTAIIVAASNSSINLVDTDDCFQTGFDIFTAVQQVKPKFSRFILK